MFEELWGGPGASLLDSKRPLFLHSTGSLRPHCASLERTAISLLLISSSRSSKTWVENHFGCEILQPWCRPSLIYCSKRAPSRRIRLFYVSAASLDSRKSTRVSPSETS